MNQNNAHHAIFLLGWVFLGLGLVLIALLSFIPETIKLQPDQWLTGLSELANSQLNRLRNLTQITQLLSFLSQLMLLWLLAGLLLPLVVFAIGPGQLQTLRLGLVLLSVFAPQSILTLSYSWLNQSMPDFSHLVAPVIQTASIMAIWLTISNKNYKVREIIAVRASLTQHVCEYLLVQLPDMIKKLPLGLAVVAILLSRNEAYIQIQDLLLLMVLLASLRLANPISNLTLIRPSGNNHIIITTLKTSLAGIWCIPLITGLAYLLKSSEHLTAITENYLWLLLLVPAWVIGVPLGIGSPPKRMVIWLVLFALLVFTGGMQADATGLYKHLIEAIQPSSSLVIIWILQITLIALITSYGWRSFSNNQRHAVSMVQTQRLLLWLLMLRKPLLNACSCGLLLAAWISVQSMLLTTILSFALAIGFACLLLQTGSANKIL